MVGYTHVFNSVPSKTIIRRQSEGFSDATGTMRRERRSQGKTFSRQALALASVSQWLEHALRAGTILGPGRVSGLQV